MLKSLFEVKGELSKVQKVVLAILGPSFILLIWYLLTIGENPAISSAILPKPSRVLGAYRDLYQDNEIIRNTMKSIGLNLAGYIEAVLIALPLGFIVGLLPLFRGSYKGMVEGFRYVALTALTGVFIAWFGVGTEMKVHFLAFGILIYLLPVVIQRIDEVDDVYLKTVYTLGANGWQTIRSVYIPSVLSRVSDDIRVLTAISWTYIIVAEGIGSTGGVGALIWRAGLRQGRVDKVFAILLIIMLIGMLQDRILVALDRLMFPYKYQRGYHKKGLIKEGTTIDLIFDFIQSIAIWILIAIYGILVIDQIYPLFGEDSLMTYFFADTTSAVHLLAVTLLAFYFYRKYKQKQEAQLFSSETQES